MGVALKVLRTEGEFTETGSVRSNDKALTLTLYLQKELQKRACARYVRLVGRNSSMAYSWARKAAVSCHLSRVRVRHAVQHYELTPYGLLINAPQM